jgi:hypothetical protein
MPKTVQATYTGRGKVADPVTGITWSRGDTNEISKDDYSRLLAAGIQMESGEGAEKEEAGKAGKSEPEAASATSE